MFWFDETNDETLAAIQKHFQCKTKSQALRMALETYANSLGLPRQDGLDPKRGSKPKRNGGGDETREATPPDILTVLLDLSKTIPLDLPEDYSERLDDYLYGDFRHGFEEATDGAGEKPE